MKPNDFGVYREYACAIPSYTPDEFRSFSDLCNSPNFIHSKQSSSSIGSGSPITFYAPFRNVSTFRLLNWYNTKSSLKSFAELNRLVNDVLLAPDFDLNDLKKFSAAREVGRLDFHHDTSSSIFSEHDGWIETSVSIPVPIEKGANMPKMSEATAPRFLTEGLYYRKITEVIKSALKESNATQYHLSPFKEFWQRSSNDPVERLYSEIYTSDAVIEEHQAIQNRMPECNLEKVMIPILIWSDSTQLASFGTASLWPVYLFLGNLSKYVRCKPSSFSAHHLAYIPKVSPIYGTP